MSWTDNNGKEQLDAFHMHRRPVRYTDGQLDPDDARLPLGDPSRLPLAERALLDRVVIEAEEARSDALVVLLDGEIMVARWFGRLRGPGSLQSITKPVSALALSWLLEEGAIEGLDVPMSTWYPELSGLPGGPGPTLRHVLTHTSGLDPGDTQALNAAPDRVAWARAAEQVDVPGRTTAYSNRAMQLLSGVVRAEAGEDVAVYLGRRLFGPLGIRSLRWEPDEAGHSPTYGGIAMDALDLAVIGQVLASEGRWGEEQLLPASWVALSLDPAASPSEHRALSWSHQRPRTMGEDSEEVIGFGHGGSGGQRLLVYPEAGLVVVRLVSIRSDNVFNQRHDARDSFGALPDLADRLALARLAGAGALAGPLR